MHPLFKPVTKHDGMAAKGLPLLIRPEDDEESRRLPDLLQQENAEFHQLLQDHGALLFQGFFVPDAPAFETVCRAGTPALADYNGGGSPRSLVWGKVYTSTEYPADQHIPLHCEESYFTQVPHHIWFFCQTPPAGGSQTPIGDMGKLLGRLDPDIVLRFHERGVRYIYNLHGGNGFGRGWKDAFVTEDRDVVTAWLEEHQASYEWQDDNNLHMDLDGPGLRHHPETGKLVWGNQAVNWHVGALPAKMAAFMCRLYPSEDSYQKHATFGDGSPIPQADIQHILKELAAAEVAFDWQKGDVLWCDNQRIAHGRRPFSGQRRILVALA